ncbi:hypothetical protein N8522_03675 [Akkermansiaceae bacterium]|nr:hypothetical protein [Akkermansiaceae bacterium]MDB4312274.1 hypothetical protein [bacterium]MDB4645651.1 hypothetical protein [Akkermansiaceae bacterium]MDB4716226.1 hypothetical protein [bacterium]MDB4729029.1 hypothetical protein [Akkermansiaceae bacterium]
MGEPPTMIFKLQGGERVQQDPLPDSAPPRAISVSGSVGREAAVPLTIGRFTPWVFVADKTLPIQLSEGVGEGAKKWATVKPPTVPMMAIFMKDRSQKKMTWKNPTRLEFAETLQAYPNESIRVINLTPAAVAVKLGEKTAISVGAGKAKIFTEDQGAKVKDTFADIRVKKNGNWARIMGTDLDLFRNQRMTILVYMGDRPETKDRVFVKTLSEPSRVPVVN